MHAVPQRFGGSVIHRRCFIFVSFAGTLTLRDSVFGEQHPLA